LARGKNLFAGFAGIVAVLYPFAATALGADQLAVAAKQIETKFGRLDVPYGDVNRIVLVDYDKTFQNITRLTDSPTSGSGDPVGGVRAVYFVPAPVANQNLAIDGDTYVQLVKFTKSCAQAWALLDYGNASRPVSPHITDQFPLFQAKKLRAVYRTQEEVARASVIFPRGTFRQS
jgi:acyl-homoserine-lactone acylase